MGRRLVTVDVLGAWVIKCDPTANPDVPRAVRTGEAWVARRWCVADNYRSRMMRPGDRAILWVSGDGRVVPRGIWGLGRVTGEVRPVGGAEPSITEVSLDIPLAAEPLTPDQIKVAGVLDLEVLRQPFGTNPSWVSRDQLAALEGLLGEWPVWTP